MTTNPPQTTTIICPDCRNGGRGEIKLTIAAGWIRCQLCGYREPAPADIALKQQGQPQLPGFGQ